MDFYPQEGFQLERGTGRAGILSNPGKGTALCQRKEYNKNKVKRDHLCYHAVWAAVHELAKKFRKAYPSAAGKWEQLRTHSGRATRIRLMMGEGISLAMSMEFAWHAKSSIKTHLAYGRLTTAHVHKYLMEERARQIGKLSDMLQQPNSQPAQPPENRKRVTGKQSHQPEEDEEKKVSKIRILQGCSLKDVMEWHASGKLTDEELAKVKGRLLEIM